MDSKLINKILANQIQYIKIIFYDQVKFTSGKQNWFNMEKC